MYKIANRETPHFSPHIAFSTHCFLQHEHSKRRQESGNVHHGYTNRMKQGKSRSRKHRTYWLAGIQSDSHLHQWIYLDSSKEKKKTGLQDYCWNRLVLLDFRLSQSLQPVEANNRRGKQQSKAKSSYGNNIISLLLKRIRSRKKREKGGETHYFGVKRRMCNA